MSSKNEELRGMGTTVIAVVVKNNTVSKNGKTAVIMISSFLFRNKAGFIKYYADNATCSQGKYGKNCQDDRDNRIIRKQQESKQ